MTNLPVNRPAETLSVHPLLRPVPCLPSESPVILALVDSVETHGCLRPLIVNERDEVMDLDGRDMLLAAHKAGLKDLPCIVRPDEDAASIILDTLCGRRHLSKSALAYIAFPLLEQGASARQKARIRGLNAGNAPRQATQLLSGKTVEQTAAQLGFSREYFYKARQVYHLFAQELEYKARMEPRLLTDDEEAQVSLQGVLAGFTGLQNTGKPRRQADQLDLFGSVFDKLRYHFKRTWGGMDDGKRAALVPQVRETVAEMPPEVRAVFVAEIKAAERAAKEVGQNI